MYQLIMHIITTVSQIGMIKYLSMKGLQVEHTVIIQIQHWVQIHQVFQHWHRQCMMQVKQ